MTATDRPALGNDGIAALVRLRLRMLGAGEMGPAQSPDGRTVLSAMLPGTDSMLRLWKDTQGNDRSQVFYADGNPVSGVLDPRDPVAFAALMHNVDCGFVHAGLSAPLVSVFRAADALYAKGVGADATGSRLDLGDWSGAWDPRADGGALMSAAGEPRGDGFAPGMDEFSAASLGRWRSQVADWVLGQPRAEGIERVDWRMLGTLEESRAASMRAGHGGAPVQPWHDALAGVPLPQALRCWMLESRADGMPLLLAMPFQGRLQVVPAKGATVAPEQDEAVALLATELGLALSRPAAPGGPRR